MSQSLLGLTGPHLGLVILVLYFMEKFLIRHVLDCVVDKRGFSTESYLAALIHQAFVVFVGLLEFIRDDAGFRESSISAQVQDPSLAEYMRLYQKPCNIKVGVISKFEAPHWPARAPTPDELPEHQAPPLEQPDSPPGLPDQLPERPDSG